MPSNDNKTVSKKELMQQFGIASRTTLSDLLNKRLAKYLEGTSYQKNDKYLYPDAIKVLVEKLGYTRELF